MPRNPDVPCAGGCGKLLWGGGIGSLPAGERTCRDCRRVRREALAATKPPPIVRAQNLGNPCQEPGCTRKAHSRLLCRPHYRKIYGTHWSQGDPERRKARNREHTHRRRVTGRYQDVTSSYEQELRRKATHCPLCKVRMTVEPYQDNSKELDHMIPLNIGGTHTIGNVRIICRQCNTRRPWDGSDYLGPVTLWAATDLPSRPRPASRVRLFIGAPPSVPAPCPCGEELEGLRCWTCQPARVWKRDWEFIPRNTLTPEQREHRGRRAAQLHEAGQTWWEVARSLRYGSAGAAYLAAKDARVTLSSVDTQGDGEAEGSIGIA